MRKLFTSLLALASTIGAIILSANPASALVTDGRDPQNSGCSSDAYNVASWPLYDNSGIYQANVELRYSPHCGSNWVRVTQQNAAYMMISDIRLDKPNGTYTGNGDFARGVGNGYAYWWTGMVSAPGSTCVIVEVSGNTSMARTLYWERKVC
ncbi:DUF2690 domain-containing protein [Arthrobacter sp.]|uniref:DUF2690 domain-containing protein n=1 Tax=Arthrobacter sp. TaxID=1667 RepID=UPI00339004F7